MPRMCGFAGIVAWEDRYRFDRATLGRMNARIAHRGPDGEGLWLNHDGEVNPARPQAGLAHRRLAIIDLDQRANQPFTDNRGRHLAFNGEIYNYRELRRELESLLPDYPWRTQSDTEVLLASYAAWGDKCVDHLNGMFAFAIWDENNHELFLARDRMGQKPLYYSAIGADGQPWRNLPATHADGVPIDAGDPLDRGRSGRVLSGQSPVAIAFASELGALAQVPWFQGSTDEGALRNYLRYGYVPTVETIYQGALKLPPRSRVRFGARGFEASAYFDANRGDPDQSESTKPTRARELIVRAVQRQLVADVPVGCFLSGGVDSSIIAAASMASGARLSTFSIGFDDPRYDETRYAAEVARHLGTDHHEFRVTPDAAADLPKLAEVFGEPFADSSALPTHYLARETRRRVKVALSGDGGDELFGGYDRYRVLAARRRVGWAMQLARGVRADRALRSMGGASQKSTAHRLARAVATYRTRASHQYAAMMRLYDEDTLDELWPHDSDPHAHGFELLASFFNIESRLNGRQRRPAEAALALDRVTYLPDDLLTKVDRCSMLHALEVRSPFMDHDLVEFAATLTTRQLLKGGPKRMLREAFANRLPAWVFKRKKMGFAVPIGEWFRGDLRPMLHDHLFAADSFAAAHFNTATVRRLIDEHERERVDHSQRLYALLMLELWWRNQRP